MEDEGKKKVTPDILEKAYRFTTINFNYADVVSVMSKGPNTRGKQRRMFLTTDGKSLDLYGLLVESLAKNPPLMELDFNLVYERVVKLIQNEGDRPDRQSVRTHLNHLQVILKGKEEIYRAIEWKDGMIYVLDPLFLFYLRWGRSNG